jgi:hypothetical protein
MGMGFLQGFSALDTLSEPSVKMATRMVAGVAVELAMVNAVGKSYDIFALLAEHSDKHGPLAQKIPNSAQFLYEAANSVPNGIEKFDKESLDKLEKESIQQLPYIPDGIDVVKGTEEDFQALKKYIHEFESDRDKAMFLNATTGSNVAFFLFLYTQSNFL